MESPTTGRRGSRLATLLGESRPERLRTLGLFAFFFLVIAAFWVQKPIRTSRFLSNVGPELLPVVKLGTALLVLPVALLYSSLAARIRRAALVYCCVGAFAALSLVFWWMFSRAGVEQTNWTSYAYFFYVDIFNSVMVALFWSVANDLNTPDEARRTYGLIGAGGIVGGAVGSAVTGWSVERLGAPNLLLVCIAILGLIALLAALLARLPSARRDDEQKSAGAALRDAVAGAKLTVASQYLTGIALLVVGYELVSNIIDYQFNTMVAARYRNDAAIAAFLGRFSTASNTASLVVQLALTTWVLRRWGPRLGLLILPVALGLGSAGFVVMPMFAMIAATFFGDAALAYSLNQTTKEVLYTPTDEATKYQAKAFIDMFLMRLAKGCSALLILASTAWWLPNVAAVHWLGVLSLAVISGWILVAYATGRAFARRAGEASEPADAGVPAAAPAPATANRRRWQWSA